MILVVVAGFGTYALGSAKKNSPEYPEYFNFSGHYVFSVPKSTKVDEDSVPGISLVYSGTMSAKNLDDIYNIGGISLQPISDLTEHNGKAFKAYVNDTFLPSIKKNLATDNVQLTFAKTNGWDVARVIVVKDGQQLRFIYLKNGQHPVAVVSKEETDALKKIEITLVDVEKSDLKDEEEPTRAALTATVQLVRDENAKGLYESASNNLRVKTTEAELANALKTSEVFIKWDATISGVSYGAGEFSVEVSFRLPYKDAIPKFGTMDFIKADGKWKLKGLTLPTVIAPATSATK